MAVEAGSAVAGILVMAVGSLVVAGTLVVVAGTLVMVVGTLVAVAGTVVGEVAGERAADEEAVVGWRIPRRES